MLISLIYKIEKVRTTHINNDLKKKNVCYLKKELKGGNESFNI